jgi:hypothetical protein
VLRPITLPSPPLPPTPFYSPGLSPLDNRFYPNVGLLISTPRRPLYRTETHQEPARERRRENENESVQCPMTSRKRTRLLIVCLLNSHLWLTRLEPLLSLPAAVIAAAVAGLRLKLINGCVLGVSVLVMVLMGAYVWVAASSTSKRPILIYSENTYVSTARSPPPYPLPRPSLHPDPNLHLVHPTSPHSSSKSSYQSQS